MALIIKSKIMKNLFTLFLGLLFVCSLYAQKPRGVVMKASIAPVLDGEIDEVWKEAETYNIDNNFQQELPSLGESGETTWKALWTEEGMYLLLEVTDDVYYPSWVSGGANSYQYDKPEVYFDVNYVLEDGLGCQGNVNQGHYQFDLAMSEATVNGERTDIIEEKNGLPFVYSNAFKVDDPNYIAEYFFPFLAFQTKEGGPIDIAEDVGFDVTIIDNDPPGGDNDRQRAVWANMGGIDESWANMDNAGIITFDGAEPPVFVEEIILSVNGNITEDNQTLQVMAEVLPEDAATNFVKWTIQGVNGERARAKISQLGVITPIIDEEVIIWASSLDGFVFSNEVSVSISGQKPTKDELNYIGNGNFDDYDAESGVAGPPWTGGGVVVDGIASMTNPIVKIQDPQPWDWVYGQEVNVPWEIREESFVFSFKMWADGTRTFTVDFEDTANDYPRYGVSTDPESTSGTTDWTFDLSPVPTVYTLTCTFENMLENAVQKMNFMLGLATPTVYVDSIYLLSVNDMALIPTSSHQNAIDESFRVYPNPATSKLNIAFSKSNFTVAIYNSIGVKMDEEVVFGTYHTFDISRYPKGLYFVKANGSVLKFIK